jgi:hypothetical protein
MVASNAGFVLFGLSLANEGLPGSDHPHQIFDHYYNGLDQLLTKTRALGATPIVASCYPNSGYTAAEYSDIRQMNLLTQTSLDAPPNINFLGAIDDGQGRWVDGFHVNSGHPNDAGSTEMFLSIVPSLFDAIAAGKPSQIARASDETGTRVMAGADQSVKYIVPANEPMHSFTFAFSIKTTASGMTVGSVAAAVAPAPAPAPPPPPGAACGVYCKEHTFAPDECNCGVCGSYGGCSWTCDANNTSAEWPLHPCPNSIVVGRTSQWTKTPSSNIRPHTPGQELELADPFDRLPRHGAVKLVAPFGASSFALEVSKAGTVCVSDGTTDAPCAEGGGAVVNDGGWHTILLTHYYCNGTTNLYVDASMVSQTRERLAPTSFNLGGGDGGSATRDGGATVAYRDMLVYRAGMNVDEITFLQTNTSVVLQASLEVYAPLVGSTTKAITENKAQSMSVVDATFSVTPSV